MRRSPGAASAVDPGRRDAWGIAILCALTFGLLHQIFVTRVHPDALYMDSLRLLYQVQAWEHGRMSFAELWGLGSAHRGFINPLMLLMNVHLFSLDVMLANRLTGVVVALAVLVLLHIFNTHWQRHDAVGWVLRVTASVLIAALSFSWAGFELFTLDLGLPLWIKNTCFVVFFAFHARYIGAGAMSVLQWAQSTAALAVAGVLIVMFVGMGWSYAFVGAVVVVQGLSACVDVVGRRRSLADVAKRTIPVLCIFMALIWSFAQGTVGGQVEDGASFARLTESLPELGRLVLYALGSAWVGAETLGAYGASIDVALWFGLAGLFAAGWVVIDRLKRGLNNGSSLPIYLVGYSVLTAASLAVARGDSGVHAVMASRYYMDLVLFPVGVLWMAAESAAAKRFASTGLINAGVFALLASSILLATGLNGKREWAAAPYRAQVFEAMNVALRDGVPDEAAAVLLQSPLEHARLGAAVLRDKQLALFSANANSPILMTCDPAGIFRSGEWNGEEHGGRWMGESARLTVPAACDCDLTAELFLPEGFQPRYLDIAGGHDARQLALEPGRSVQLVLPMRGGERNLTFTVSTTTTPSETIRGNSDVRRLGVFWSGMAFACEPAIGVR